MSEHQVNVEWSINRTLDNLDELIAFANNSETIAHLRANEKFVGMIKTRTDLLVSFLQAQNQSKLRIISNG